VSDAAQPTPDTTAAREAIVELRGVEFSYPGAKLRIEALDLSVARGETLAIVGPNGSGKTTLLRLIAGLLRPRTGTVRVCAMDPVAAQRRALARRVAVVGPQTPLGFGYTVLEVVLMGRAPHVDGFRLESESDLEAARRAMAATGVAELAERIYDTLSSGERQRAAVARALAQEPELLLLDEPGAFLDIKHQTALYELLLDLNENDGLTVVSVLHDLNLASLYFERVAMLDRGRLHAIGTPEEVITYSAIRKVFDTDVYVDLNDLTGSLNVLPLPSARRRRNA
jgi:iron complex transport system ATP-binding protein